MCIRDREYIDALPKEITVIEKEGSYEVDGVKITGIPVFHDEEQGKQRGIVITYVTVSYTHLDVYKRQG